MTLETFDVVQVRRSEYDRLLREHEAFAKVCGAIDSLLASASSHGYGPNACSFVAGQVSGIVKAFNEAEARLTPVMITMEIQVTCDGTPKEPDTDD